ncbi:hypothetical protein D1B33_07400 [Lysinibacillus yapensis]|uniref:Uncharacterized protein n=1 Tax=Ureibacillus yapensis TaxID=2304605 RepID=A0A396SCE2_9BACL|nr:hypothetical protein [Lysinibacillus yapensis]RHW38690.1 hypothetical protein D1B33_07400 [Lysinibacillus yapensis]
MNKYIFNKKVPKDRLVHHVKHENIQCNKNNMDEMYDALYKEKKHVLEDVFRQYKYAGATSLNIYEIVGFPQNLNNKKSFLAHIKEKLGLKTNILNKTLNPGISEVPQIYLIEENEKGFLIQWVYGVEVINSNGYEIISRIDARYVTTIVSFGNPVFIEVRAGYKNAVKYIKLFQELLSENEHPVELIRLPLTKLSESEAEDVAKILKAGLLEGEHLGSNGIGKYAVSASPDTKDLRELEEYKNSFMGKQYLSQTLNVHYEEIDTGYSTEVKFRINMNGGFEFKTKVSERIIKRIFDVFAEVRYRKKIAAGE